MSEFSFQVNLKVHQCYDCNITFAIPENFDANRRGDGKPFFCPNQHKLQYPGIEPRHILKAELDSANQEIAKLKNYNTQLLSRLDQAEAVLAQKQKDS